jgi:hypothetical protein
VGKCPTEGPKRPPNGRKVREVKRESQKNGISSGKLLSINPRFCGSYSELP